MDRAAVQEMIAYYLKYSELSVYENMAIDEFLMRTVNEPVLRFFAFDKPSITIGMNQRYERAFINENVEKACIPVTRRITGGRTVYHCGDLTYSFSSSFEAFSAEGNSLADRYRKLSEALKTGFENAGIDVEMNAGQSETPYGANCFNSTSLYEISLKGNKILGSAQMFDKDRFLQQGTILARNCGNDVEVFSEGFLTKNIENIAGILYNNIDLSEKFYQGFFSAFDYEWREYDFRQDSLYREILDKYSDEKWIKRR